VPISSIGSFFSSTCTIERMFMLSCRLTLPEANWALTLNATSVSSSDTNPTTQAAPILPLTMALREPGVASNGSSDCRSRSPAVVSITRYAPPMNEVRVSSTGSSIDSIMPRLASVLAMSWVAMSSGRATCASTPRAIRRRAPTCPL